MHKIYVNKGAYDLETQIPITIYSSLISIIFDSLLTYLALINDRMVIANFMIINHLIILFI